MRRILFLIIFIFCAFIKLYSQDFDTRRITSSIGLSNSSVTSILQDSEGQMWFGTWDGLNMYDGKSITVFKPEPGNDESISNNIIREMIEQKPGILWIATDRGINRLDIKTGKAERFFFGNSGWDIPTEHAFIISKDSRENIFAFIYGQGAFVFNDKTRIFEHVSMPGTNGAVKAIHGKDNNLYILNKDNLLQKVKLSSDERGKICVSESVELVTDATNIFLDSRDSSIWYSNQNGVLSNLENHTTLIVPTNVGKTGEIFSLCLHKGVWQIGTANGLFRYDPDNGLSDHILKGIPVLSLTDGTQDILWVGTDMQGVYQLSDTKASFTTYPEKGSFKFGNSAVRSFYEDIYKRLWVGTKGSGIFILSKEHFGERTIEKQFTTDNGLINNSVYALCEGESEIWIGTDGKGLNYYDMKSERMEKLTIPDSLQNNLSSVYVILRDGKDGLWVGTSGHGIFHIGLNRNANHYHVTEIQQLSYTGKPGSISNNIVYSMIPDGADGLLVGTRGRGIDRLDFRTGKFTPFGGENSELHDTDVLCMYKDSIGSLWVGTSQGLFNISDGKTRFFTEQNGIPNNTIHGILEDSMHSIWISTNRGLARILAPHGEYRIISYYESDGLQGNEFSDGAFYRAPSNSHFFFGGIAKFNEFDPLSIPSHTYMPKLLFKGFSVDNEKVDISTFLNDGNQTLELSWRNKSFSFNFVPIDYLNGSKCEIAYYLEGWQSEWIEIGSSNSIVFTNIPHGKYKLHVRCSNADKVWSTDIFTLDITISTPWYKTIYANIAYILFIALLMYLTYRTIRFRLDTEEKIRNEEMEKQKIKEIQEAKLVFFTNIAHEFSNTLTLIYGPCEKLLLDSSISSIARKYLKVIASNSDRMQSMIRQLLDFRKADTGHLKLEITSVDITEMAYSEAENYREIMEEHNIHFSMSFQPSIVIWNVDRSSTEKIIFNLLSNAVKYTPDFEQIIINCSISDDMLTLRVTNTGIGIDKEHQISIFDRYEVVNKVEQAFTRGNMQSTGIGLALCKSLVDAMGGNIKVDSDGSTYTTFIVTIPKLEPTIEAITEKPLAEKKLSQEPIMPTKVNADVTRRYQHTGHLTALIVDDEQEIREFIKDLIGTDFTVMEAENGQDALTMVHNTTPDIIISDVMMPVMDGDKMVRELKSDETTRHIPVILLSAKSTMESQIEGLENGADAYIAKPFNPRHLMATMNNLLNREKAIIDYSRSANAAMQKFGGNVVKKEDREFILRVTDLIISNMNNGKLNMTFLAEECSISQMQLYRKVKELLQMTPMEYIKTLRMERAGDLLTTTSMSVQEVMYECGFSSKSYFFKEFAAKFSCTPKEYRKKR